MLSYKEIKKLKLHDPFISENNRSYFVAGTFPIDRLEQILPEKMAIPSDEVMEKEFPNVGKIKGMHPILLLFSRCCNVHDVITKIELRPYLELLFYFPVIYKHKGEERLCSYLPVLYLDTLIGTMGGLFLGLRKQYHPQLKCLETDRGNSYILDDIIRASFQPSHSEKKVELDSFFTKIFKKPTVTVSYFNRALFYTASIQPAKVLDVSADYHWNYKGTVVENNEKTIASYCEYSFTTSWAMGYAKYFRPKYPVNHVQYT